MGLSARNVCRTAPLWFLTTTRMRIASRLFKRSIRPIASVCLLMMACLPRVRYRASSNCRAVGGKDLCESLRKGGPSGSPACAGLFERKPFASPHGPRKQRKHCERNMDTPARVYTNQAVPDQGRILPGHFACVIGLSLAKSIRECKAGEHACTLVVL